MSTELLGLFAITDDENSPIKTIPLSSDLHIEITNYLTKQMKEFYIDQREVDFSGEYNADEGEIFRIKNFPLDKDIVNAIKEPLGCDTLNLREIHYRILALFAGKSNGNNIVVAFQSFDSRKILSKGFTILEFDRIYKKLRDPGLTLQDRLTALYTNGHLYFYSYHNTRHFIDLSNYYREASDADLKSFALNRSLFIEDTNLFMQNADSIIRKKITLLQRNKVLGKVDIKEIKTSAKRFGLDLELKGGKKIVMPSDKNELLNILRFLDEDYFDSVLTKRKCLTNSKKYL